MRAVRTMPGAGRGPQAPATRCQRVKRVIRAAAYTLRASPRRVRDGWRGIGPHLLVGLLLVIVPTGVIGVMAAQRFDALATTTTELSMQDLPEVVAIGHLRTLLYRQRDLERAEAHDRAAQTALRASIAAQQSALQALEPPDSAATWANDTTLITGLTTGITRAGALALRLQALRAGGRVAAHALFQHAYAPLLDTVLADTARLRTLHVAGGGSRGRGGAGAAGESGGDPGGARADPALRAPLARADGAVDALTDRTPRRAAARHRCPGRRRSGGRPSAPGVHGRRDWAPGGRLRGQARQFARDHRRARHGSKWGGCA